jgi:glyoxylase-like metal-dependent hydrolase (beta-lactamase superfamily II)
MKRLISILLIATALTAAKFAAAAAGPVAVEPAATPFQIGALHAFALADAKFLAANDGSLFGAEAGPDEVGKILQAAGAPADTISLSVTALLVKDGKHVVLLDTGLGPKVKGVLLQSLGKAGLAPGDVTDVLITHSHGDHIGGLVAADGQPAFPHATVHMSAAEWAFMQSRQDAADVVKAVAAQVKTFEPGASVVPGISAVPIQGHTPGHMGYEIVSGKDRLLDIGDSAHSSILSLARPNWEMQFDTDKVLAKQSREKLLRDLAKSHEQVFSPHFPYPGVGQVVAEGDHFAWKATLPVAAP